MYTDWTWLKLHYKRFYSRVGETVFAFHLQPNDNFNTGTEITFKTYTVKSSILILK